MKKEPLSDMVNSSQQPQKGALSMVTLQENTVQFNNKLIVSHNGGQLSSDSALTLLDDLMDAFHFTQLSEKIITFNENRKYYEHSNSKILKQLILQLNAG